MVVLQERDAELARLDAAVEGATHGHGALVLVSGEAGIGKTSLVRAFVGGGAGGARVLAGACDDLLAPPSFAPLRDAVRGRGGPLAEALDRSDPAEVLSAVLAELSHPLEVTVLVVEDAHWADDATLDALAYVGRRVAGTRGVLVVTHRDVETERDHALHRILGTFTGPHVHRLRLDALSRGAVEEMARGHDVPVADLMEATQGNPFFVSEVLASGDAVPETVVDAVLARVAALPPDARTAVEQLAVLPSQVELSLVEALVGDPEVLDPAARAGLVAVRDGRLGFRHELVRLAVGRTLSATRAIALHRGVVTALVDADADPARIMHHAVSGHDAAAVLVHGPPAARAAAQSGAHRQALALFRAILPQADRLAPLDRAGLLEDYALEAMMVADVAAALGAQRQAAELRVAADDTRGAALNLRHQASMQLWAGRVDRARGAALRAVTLLESQDPAGVAPAYASLAEVEFRSDDLDACRELASRAITLARASQDDETLASALNTLGIALLSADELEGRAFVEESLHIARTAGLHRSASRAYINLAAGDLDRYEHARAAEVIEAGLAYAREHQLTRATASLLSERVWLHVRTGQWEEVEGDARAAMQELPATGVAAEIAAFAALCWLGRLRARCGDPQAAETVARAEEVARHWETSLDGLLPAAAARAELQFLEGRVDSIPGVVRPVHEQAVRMGHRHAMAELGYWLWKAGDPPEVAPADHPFGLQTRGRWREAAAAWADLGCPYERAMALGESDDPHRVLEGLAVLDGLGAAAASRLLRQRLRDLGLTRIPRGPTRATRAHPAGLTPRQVEVLELLVEGLTNAQIADRLVLSVRTVDHHVSAILARLGVTSREEAAALSV